MTPVRLEPAALRSRVKHSTTEPLRSLSLCVCLAVCVHEFINGCLLEFMCVYWYVLTCVFINSYVCVWLFVYMSAFTCMFVEFMYICVLVSVFAHVFCNFMYVGFFSVGLIVLHPSQQL